jgi:hypothetical protein
MVHEFSGSALAVKSAPVGGALGERRKTDGERSWSRSVGLAGGGVGHWGGGGLHAGVASADDIQISIDGMDLFPTTGNTATATSGMGDIAIAIGNGSEAQAGAGNAFGETLTPGKFDIAVANGTDSFASAGQGNFDSAFADGTSSLAGVGGDNNILSNGDWAAALGPDANAEAGVFSAASQNDAALVFDPFGTLGSTAESGDGNFDLTSVFGDNSFAYAGFPGNFDLGAVFGDGLTANATGGNFLVDILPSLFVDASASSAATGGNLLLDILSLL